MAAALTERQYLTSLAYADDTDLAARQQLYAYTEPAIDLVPWALDLITWRGDETVLDVGCGNGRYLVELAQRRPGVHTAGADLSLGMVRAVATRWPAGVGRAAALLQGDAQHLPVRASAADVVLAMHVLYHVPNIGLAVAELRRVVRDEGTALVTTKGAGHLAALEGLVHDALLELGVPTRHPFAWTDPFTIENGPAQLARRFEKVTAHVLRLDLVVPSIEPLLAYLRAVRALVDTPGWDAVVSIVAAGLAALIDATGSFHDQIVVGAFLCRP